jgi:hypothetical protein
MSVHTAEPHSTGHESGPGHEINTVRLAPIIVFAVILVVVSIATFITVKGILYLFEVNLAKADRALPALAESNPIPPEPRLQVASGDDLRRLRATEEETLHTYHWIDKNNGVVGLPIDRAMALVVERGLPAREQRK